MSDSSAPLTRERLLHELESGWNKFHSYIASLSEAQLTRPTDAAGWTAKDHVIHVAMFDKAELAVLQGQSKREALGVSPEVWAQDDDDATNAAMQQRDHDLPLADVLETLQQNHARLVQKLESMTDADLQLPYRHYQPDYNDDRPMIAWIPWDTYHHYSDHLPWIEAIVAQA